MLIYNSIFRPREFITEIGTPAAANSFKTLRNNLK